jgi:predicted 3-demethylubiquinone-9 3-methyltransferase (glyoxalase superfamily)
MGQGTEPMTSNQAQRITPCLWMDGTAEEAAALYTRAFPRSRVGAESRYGKEGHEQHRQPEGRVMMVEMALDGFRLTALNGGSMFRPNPSISLMVSVATAAEVDAIWQVLEEGGKAMMALGAYAWSPRYGWLEDRFGVSWQLVQSDRIAPGRGCEIVPALMFTGERCGRAEEAIATWSRVLSGEGPQFVLRHDATAGAGAGLLAHARFSLMGQPIVVSDGVGLHAFRFTEGVSLVVACTDQAEIDRLWSGLTADGGRESRCGWLTDRFGVSWQIVPARLADLSGGPDADAHERVMRALLTMGKLDIAALEAAHRG